MKKRTIKPIIFLAFFIFIFSTILYAIPADPDPVVVSQPNGKTLTVFIKGDERIHWYESMDGYTLLYNKAGYLSYAQLDENGNLQPTDYIATDIEKRDIVISSFLNTIEKQLFFSEVQVQLMFKVWEIEDEALNTPKGERGLEGELKTICAFVQFPDKVMVKSMDDFEGLFNHLGYTENGAVGSVRDYYKEVSYEKLDLTITLCGVYTAAQNRIYYSGNGGHDNVGPLVTWLAEQVRAEPNIDFRDYDNDKDGMVDGFHFIFAGIGRESGQDNQAIWSHKSQIEPVYQSGTGKYIKIYSCSPELRTGASSPITTIGVICHEMTHALGGIRDYYDTDYAIGGSYDGTGKWDLMASGNSNGSPGGSCPAHPNMHIKVLLGWVTPIVLNSRTTIKDMPNSVENNIAYKINTNTYNEYYLLENRQKMKFDSYVPGEGLLIYHVHAGVLAAGNCINCTHQQRMYPVSVSRPGPMPTGSKETYGYINSLYCPFPSTGNYYKTSFADNTIPAMRSWNNNKTGKPISNIKHENRLVSFEFMDPTYVGIENFETSGYSSLQIVPNPANEYIDVKVNGSEFSMECIEFYNFFGILVKSVPCNGYVNGETIIQRILITDLSAGVYFVKVGNETAKLVIQF